MKAVRTARAGGGGGGGFGEQNPLAAVAPDAHNITLRERQSLIQLPDAGYKPRIWDPRAGSIVTTSFNDWSKPLGESRTIRYLTRFRLEKKDPTKAVSDPVKPIVYYVDRGAPEPIRTALLEGVRWWNEAFLAAGFSNAFKAELMPEGADPLDIRYNVILWVEGENRAFSNGAGCDRSAHRRDPEGRSDADFGRERQDYLITDALLSPIQDERRAGPAANRDGVAANPAAGGARKRSHHRAKPQPCVQRLRHGRVRRRLSVPEDSITADGKLDLSHAYEPGLGEWDKVSIDLRLSPVPAGNDPGAGESRTGQNH